MYAVSGSKQIEDNSSGVDDSFTRSMCRVRFPSLLHSVKIRNRQLCPSNTIQTIKLIIHKKHPDTELNLKLNLKNL